LRISSELTSRNRKPAAALASLPGWRRGLSAVWLRLAVFLVPALVVVCLPVYLVDPYGLFARRSIVPDRVRVESATRVNQALLAIVSFTRAPTPNILLGDSQMVHFNVKDIEALTHRPFSNLAYGGGTLAESIATFWYATRTVRLQSVYFGVSFYSFIDNTRNRIGAAEHLVKSPLASFANGDVLEATFDDIVAQYLHHTVNYGPSVPVATFWQQQLGELVRRRDSFAPSASTLAELAAIRNYCAAHRIAFAFVIPPQHEDVRRRIVELGMQKEYADFKSSVIALGRTYDCDVDNDITRDRSYFHDPFHTTDVAAARVAQSIWSGGHAWCEVH
jgi:hypothetical protein